jgi:uncharacterized protein (DUF433 family)
MSTVAYPHIEVSSDGHVRIRGTGFKVRVLVEEHLNGVSVEELRRWHPHLTLSQIYSALAYYHDHKRELDQEIADLDRFAGEFCAQQGESLLAKKIREMGKELP